jgi:hypothetical protein
MLPRAVSVQPQSARLRPTNSHLLPFSCGSKGGESECDRVAAGGVSGGAGAVVGDGGLRTMAVVGLCRS